MRNQEEDIQRLKKDMYNVFGVQGGALLSKEHNLIKWNKHSLGEELFNEVYDEYYAWLVFNTTPEQIRIESQTKSLISMMESCYAYHTLSKDNYYIKKYKTILGIDLFNEVYDKEEKNLRENYMVRNDVHTDHEGVTYNSLIKLK